MNIYLIDQAGSLNGPVILKVVPGLGIQLPSNAVELPELLPEPEAGMAWALQGDQPAQMVDRRGTVYRKDTGEPVALTVLGEVPDEYTAIPRPGLYYIWGRDGWVLDTATEEASTSVKVLEVRDGKLRDAALRIAPLQYAHDLQKSTEKEEAALLAWKLYSVDLSRIEGQAGFPLAIVWPDIPV
ncbi:tail fiber assembly protein [Pseudomonas mohnii]